MCVVSFVFQGTDVARERHLQRKRNVVGEPQTHARLGARTVRGEAGRRFGDYAQHCALGE